MHKGHESMHTTMVLILIGTLIVAQIVVVEWKKRHFRSYSVRFSHINIKIAFISRNYYTDYYIYTFSLMFSQFVL
jgi:hypothetical protein